MALEDSQIPWELTLAGQSRIFETRERQQCYVLRRLAAVLRRLGQVDEAARSQEQPCAGLTAPEARQIEAWVESDG